MRKYLRSFLTLLALLITSYGEAFAATYFVRPYLLSGTYGSGDGSSYANAWNGMNALDTKWGNPVGPGDTVYICGSHLEGRPTTGPFGGEGWLRPTVSGTENARITVSGDCPDDSAGIDRGTLFSVHLQMSRFDWTDPDGDGVYSQVYGGCTSPFLLEDGTRILNWIPIDTTQNPPVPTIPYNQWPAGSFTQLGCGGAIYYKPTSGLPADHTIHTGHSRLVILTNQQYITIQGLRLYAGSSGPMHLSNADFIRIENNDIQWGGVYVFSDSDDGELIGNKIHDLVGVGFYLITGGGDVNAQSNDRWHIAHNELYNISLGDAVPGCDNCPPRAIPGDRHAIGVQGGTNGAVVEYNHIHHVGGEGIVFYNWSNYTENGIRVGNNQRDNTIRYNYVHDIKDLYPGCLSGQVACSGERGIQLGSDSQAALPDTITGNVVHHNVLARVNQIALKFKATTENGVYGWRVLNNVVYESGIGIATGTNNPDSPGPYSGVEYRNNLILNPTSAHVYVTLPTGSTVSNTDMRDLMDRNLYYPDGPLFRILEQFYHPDLETSYTFSGWQALFNLDANSLTADPLLTNPASGDFQWAGTPAVIAGAGDFRPTAGSPVIDQGASVGLMSDIAGTAVGSYPDIGTYEYPGTDLMVAVTDSPDPALTGSPLTYTVTATNAGPSAATNVVVTHALPNGVTGSGVASQGGCIGTSIISCNLGTLGNGNSATITVTATPGAEVLFDPTPSTTFNVNVSASTTVSATETDLAPANNSATTTTNVRLACLGQVVTKRGTSGNDGTSSKRFAGGSNADVIHTLSGADWIDGKGGNDTICGGAGNDNINGSGGADALSGGSGTDTCNGGSGTDTTDGSCETVNSVP